MEDIKLFEDFNNDDLKRNMKKQIQLFSNYKRFDESLEGINKFVKMIIRDPQMDTRSDMFLGFVNLSHKDIDDPVILKGFTDFIKYREFTYPMVNLLGLEVQLGSDLEEFVIAYRPIVKKI